jgi:TonB family protein
MLARGWRTVVKVALLLAFCTALGSVPGIQAQAEPSSSRKVVSGEKPDYPQILKRAGIGGVVRLKASVAANGTVANVSVLGGNPILAECAVKAVKQWRYARAAAANYEIVTLEFNPR